MNGYPYLGAWLNCLLRLLPPGGLVHIGAGSALPYPYASMPRLLVVEADVRNCNRLQNQLQEHAGCQVVQAVVAGHTGEADFYNLSQSSESGLCPSAELQDLWPNIKTLHTSTQPVTTLQELIEKTSSEVLSFNWVVVDCLPAGELLKGAGALPAQWDVVLIRALKDLPILEDDRALGVGHVQKQLLAYGLELVAMEDENHPQVVRALFVRRQSMPVAIINGEAIARSTALTRERDAALRYAEQLAEEKTELERDFAGLTAANAELAALCNAESSGKADALTQCEALAKRLTEAYVQRFQTAQENAILKAESSELLVAREQFELQNGAEGNAQPYALVKCASFAQEIDKAMKHLAEIVDNIPSLEDDGSQQFGFAKTCQDAVNAVLRDLTIQRQKFEQLDSANRDRSVPPSGL